MVGVYQWKAIKFVWSNSKGWLFGTLFFSILNGFLPFVNLWVAKELINAVARFFQGEDANALTVFWLLAAQFFAGLLSSLISHLKQYMDSRVEAKLDYQVQQMVLHKTSSVPILYYDIPEFYNHLNRVSGGAAHLLSPLRTGFSLLEAVLSIGSYFTFLFMIHWSLILVSLLTAIPVLLVQSKFSKKRYTLLRNQTPVSREANYYSALLKDRESAKEIRLFALESFFLQRWAAKYLQNLKESLLLAKKQHSATIGLDAFTGLFYLGAASVIIWLAGQTKLTVGDFISIVQAIQGAQGVLGRISTLLADAYEDSFYLKDFYSLLAFEEPSLSEGKRDKECPAPIQEGIHFEHVSFRYLHSSEETLKDISFTIKPNEKIAIVGENGSGKTTLIKCLLGLYTVTNGRIMIDGININDIARHSLYRQITVIFQDFIRYLLSVAENIGIGDSARMDHSDEIKHAAKLSGADSFVRRLPQGYDTRLGRMLSEGEDLSGGQWQRVALSRALFRNSQVVILDEPTAALDPLAEMELFDQFHHLAENKTAIFISHRMAATKLADRILVLKDGLIAEMGTHDELMALGQEYYRMYQTQARWFSSGHKCEAEMMEWTS